MRAESRELRRVSGELRRAHAQVRAIRERCDRLAQERQYMVVLLHQLLQRCLEEERVHWTRSTMQIMKGEESCSTLRRDGALRSMCKHYGWDEAFGRLMTRPPHTEGPDTCPKCPSVCGGGLLDDRMTAGSRIRPPRTEGHLGHLDTCPSWQNDATRK